MPGGGPGLSRLAKQQGGVRIGSKHRVFKVVISDVPLAAHPEEWQGLLGYAFYEKDPASGRVREFDHLLIGEERDKRYWDRFEDLASDIKETLDFLRDDAQPGPQSAQDRAPTAAASSGAVIYVAETTSDLSADRDNIRRELQQHGCQVLPDRPLPMSARALEQAVRADLRETRLSVHLVGAHYGVIPEMERNRSSVRMQLDLAAERCGDASFSRLVWMPIGLSSEDERQQALIDELQRSAQAGSDLLQTNLEELKTCIHAKLAPKPKPATPADGEEGLPRVYLLCDREDYDDTKSLVDFLSDRGVVVLPPPIEGDETLISQYHKESLQACDALMIYYGRVGDTWAQLKRLELLKLAGLGRERRLRAKAFYLSVPTTSQKERFRCPGALVIKNYQGFHPESLESFLAHLKQGGTASP